LATTPAVCSESHANKEVSVTEYEGRSDRFTALEDRFAGYEVYDQAGEKIGKVDDLFVDESDQPEYIGVKMGFLGMSSTLIPWEAVSSTDDEDKAITIAIDKDKAKDGPPSTTIGRSRLSSRTRSTPTTASSAPRPPRTPAPTTQMRVPMQGPQVLA
jgi:sporulation protein YlmC with PRC-barrel domain